MGPRAALILAGLSAVLLCGCSADNSANMASQDLSSWQSSDLGIPTDGAFCEPNITITASPGPDVMGGQLFAPQDLVATSDPVTSPGRPEWTVQLANGSVLIPMVIDPASGLIVSFHAPVPGSYTFRTRFPDGCQGMRSQEVFSRNSKSAFYTLRVSPPAPAGVPQQDLPLQVFGGTPVGDHDLFLNPGSPVQSTLTGPGGAPVAGEVRFLGADGPDALTTAGANGVFVVAVNPSLKYTPLLIPTGSALAPRLIGTMPTSGIMLGGLGFSVDAGVQVSGTITDPGGAPIAGARVVLRSGKLPSTTGISAADGTYTLRAQAGSYVASIGADGWPEVTLPAVTAPATLDLKYLVSRTAVTATVVASGGAPMAGARVTLRSPLLAGVATASVGGLTSGRMKQVAISGADGTIALMLPSANYDLLIEPPTGATDGVTALQQTVAAAWMLGLQPKITLSGKVTNLLDQAVGDVKVTGFETAGLGAAPSARSASNGTWSLTVDPGSPVELLFEPPGAANLSSARIGLAAGSTHADAALSPGLRIGGFIQAPGGGKLAAVVVQALCSGCGSDAPIATAISDGSGAYALYFPDPGVVDVDGGADLSP